MPSEGDGPVTRFLNVEGITLPLVSLKDSTWKGFQSCERRHKPRIDRLHFAVRELFLFLFLAFPSFCDEYKSACDREQQDFCSAWSPHALASSLSESFEEFSIKENKVIFIEHWYSGANDQNVKAKIKVDDRDECNLSENSKLLEILRTGQI